MEHAIKDRYILLSVAAVAVLILICSVGSFTADGTEGNGITEITGMISEPSPSQNGTVFKVTDLNGNEFRCFFRSGIPEAPSLCRLIGSSSSDGNMFFVDRIIVIEKW